MGQAIANGRYVKLKTRLGFQTDSDFVFLELEKGKKNKVTKIK